jgi:eukaryotic-like serine/threonine-protein kinase
MSGTDEEHPEDLLAEALAAFDDRLAAGMETPGGDTELAIEPALLSDWNRLTAFLSLVERAWPRADASMDRPTEPARARAATSAVNLGTAPTASEDDRRFGRFQIERTLGQGGFGIVFLAWDPSLRRHVALKVPQPEALVTPESRKRFQREAHAAAGLDHPNIVPVHESGSVGTVSYIAAAYIEGPTLSAWLKCQTQVVPARDAAGLVAKLAKAVYHAHERGVLHRDLKPSNILLQGPIPASDRDQGEYRLIPLVEFEPRITDFSLAKIADGLGPDTKSGIPFGSPPYMAPEQADGKLAAIGPPTDVYGLGCILYELLTGGPPFVGESVFDTLRQIIALEPVPPGRRRRDVSAALESIVLKCLEKEPARRYASAFELAADLDRFLAGEATRARPPGRWDKFRKKVRRQKSVFAILATVVTSVLLLLAGSQWYEVRLNTDRRLVQRQASAERERAEAQQAYINYARSIRQADELIGKFHRTTAWQILENQRPRPGEKDVREFAWYHLMRRCQTEHRTLTGHRGDVYFVAFSPRGDLLASAGKDGTVRIWNTATWKLIRQITASSTEVNVATFAPDGNALATVDGEGKLKVWETATGRKLFETKAHVDDAVIALFTRDGKTIITGGRTDGLIKFWDRVGALVASLVTENQVLECAAISPDESIVATGGTHGVKLWDSASKTLRAALPRSAGAQGIAFSYNGTTLSAAFEADRLFRVWDISSLSMEREDSWYPDGLFGTAFASGDNTIISRDRDSTIRRWDTRAGQGRGIQLGYAGRIWNLAAAPGEGTIASAGQDGTVKVWNTKESRPYLTFWIGSAGPVGFENGGRTVLTLELFQDWSIGRWDANSGLLMKRTPLELIGRPNYHDFTNDGQSLVTVDDEGAVNEWDTVTGRRQGAVAAGSGKVVWLKISPRDRYICMTVDGPKFGYLIWDRVNCRVIPLPRENVKWIVFAASGEPVLMLKNGVLVRWDPSNGQTTERSLDSRYHNAMSTFSPDGHSVAFADPETRSIHLLSAQTLELVREFTPQPVEFKSIVFSPDGKTLAVQRTDRTVKLLDTATGDELIQLEGFGRNIFWTEFAPDGMALVTASNDGRGQTAEVRIYRTAGNEP